MTNIPARNSVTLYANLDEPLSRGLWLIKWLLLIPHYIVLSVLGFVAAFTFVFTFFAILFTGRYPRSLFDFHLAIIRWAWRVEFYGYQALATDQYPPFQLFGDIDYPADISIDYPENLNRWLVLVKWLLVLPHLIVLGILRGSEGGLSTLLVMIAAVILLFTGRYPRSIYDLLMGIHQWWYRTVVYFVLMTDKYPEFRLEVPPTLGSKGYTSNSR